MAVRKRSLIIAGLLVAALVVLTPSLAFANYAVHGGYSMATDACAGCHRAHTAPSPITWTDTTGEERSALLLSLAPDTEQFCYTCHGVSMEGADTNVFDGIYEADDADLGDDAPLNNAGDPLNGGGFNTAVYPTVHYPALTNWVAYGGGPTGLPGAAPLTNGGVLVDISCTICHDVHGSSNYRILKDIVNAVPVGGYDSAAPFDEINPNPTPWVVSAEPGYPTGGWLLHEPGAAQVAGYSPDYTDPMYGKPADGDGDGNPDLDKGISGWCASCHTQYNTMGETVTSSVYDANDGYGFVTRHRHPVNVAMDTYAGYRSLVVTTQPLPLAHDDAADAATQDSTDWIDCLTCHVAHGSSAIMTGYANVEFTTMWDTPWGTTEPEIVADSGTGGVPPTGHNALLRGNNRYVCEACHNK
jgi:predicted CXXCH cytochrome family protein